MIKNRTKAISIITGAVLSICIVMALVIHLSGITVQGAMETAEAGATIEHAGEEIDDYNLVVLEDEELPAAAAPVESKATTALYVMAAAFIIVLLIGYELWYEGVQARIKGLCVGDKEEAGILRGVNRLHPFKTMQARREMETKAAEDYFK